MMIRRTGQLLELRLLWTDVKLYVPPLHSPALPTCFLRFALYGRVAAFAKKP